MALWRRMFAKFSDFLITTNDILFLLVLIAFLVNFKF